MQRQPDPKKCQATVWQNWRHVQCAHKAKHPVKVQLAPHTSKTNFVENDIATIEVCGTHKYHIHEGHTVYVIVGPWNDEAGHGFHAEMVKGVIEPGL